MEGDEALPDTQAIENDRKMEQSYGRKTTYIMGLEYCPCCPS